MQNIVIQNQVAWADIAFVFDAIYHSLRQML